MGNFDSCYCNSNLNIDMVEAENGSSEESKIYEVNGNN
jgi:hypothetical protein